MRSRPLGQGMTEYVIVVALIAIASIAVYRYLGDSVRNQTAAMAKELAGQDGKTQVEAAQAAATAAAESRHTKRSLDAFTGNSSASTK
jgi:type IV pilus assembly protein PilA